MEAWALTLAALRERVSELEAPKDWVAVVMQELLAAQEPQRTVPVGTDPAAEVEAVPKGDGSGQIRVVREAVPQRVYIHLAALVLRACPAPERLAEVQAAASWVRQQRAAELADP